MDLSQRDMAEMIPMNQSNYSKIERGIQEPSMEQMRRICQILKLDPRFILGIDIYCNITFIDIPKKQPDLPHISPYFPLYSHLFYGILELQGSRTLLDPFPLQCKPLRIEIISL